MAAKKKLAAKTRPTASAGERGGVSRVVKAKPIGKPKAKAAAAAPAAPKKASRVDVVRADERPARARTAPVKKTVTKAPAHAVAAKVVQKAATPTKLQGRGVKGAKAATAVASAAAIPSKTLAPGDRAPSFQLPDQSGVSVSSAELAGNGYVLYFYPKDDTPGCTTQACGFRDASSEFEDTGVRVIGVSPDSVSSHQRFVSKYALPFTLLSDSSQELASAYGVWSLKKNYGREYMGIVRSTFLIDSEGVVKKVWRGVRVNGHVAEVRAAAAELT